MNANPKTQNSLAFISGPKICDKVTARQRHDFVPGQVKKKGKTLEEAKQLVMSQVGQNFRDFLAAREDGKPFCFLFGPTTTHRKWLKGSGATQWGTDPDDLKDTLPPFLPNVHEVREDLNDYFGQAMAFDKGWMIVNRKDPQWRPFFDRYQP